MAVHVAPGCRFVPISGERNMRKMGTVKVRHHFETRAQKIFTEHLLRTYRVGEHSG